MEVADTYPQASRLRRLVNLLIDTVAGTYLFGALLGAIFGLAFRLTGFADQGILIVYRIKRWVQGDSPYIWLFFLLPLIYYFLSEALFSRSLGKLITGTKVVSCNKNRKPGALQILGRTLLRLMPFEWFSFLGDDPSGWHDKLSNTKVVYIRNKKMS